MLPLSLRRFWQLLQASTARRPVSPRPGRRRNFRPGVESLEDRLTPAIDIWTGANHLVDNNWSDASNWSLGHVPGTGDTVSFTSNSSVKSFTSNIDTAFTVAGITIDNLWGGTVNVNAALTDTGSWSMASGTFGGNGAVSIAGAASSWTGGTLSVGTGGFANSGTLGIATTGNLVLTGGGTLSTSGTINQTGTATLFIENGSTVSIGAAGTYNLQADANITQSGGGLLTNAGLLEKTAGTGTSFISSSFANTGGTINVSAGTISLDTSGGTSTGGTFTVAAGAVLNLTGGNTVAYSGTYSGSGAGTVSLANGTLAVAAPGATLNFPAGLFQWTGGTIDASAGSLTNASTGVMTLAGGSNVVFNAGTLTNNGTFVQTSTAYLFLENSAIFANTASGTYNLQEDGGGITELGGGTLTNAGLLEKTSGTATTFINSSFVNSASITVTTGTLSLDTSGGTSTGGTFSVSPSATLDLTGGNAVAYAGTYTGSGGGTVALSHGTLVVDSTGVTLNFPAPMFQWTAGSIDATAGNLTNSNTITYAGTSNVVFNAGTLTNNGSFVHTSTAYLFLENGATFANTASGTYNLQEDGGGITELGGGTLTNAGLLEKTTGSSASFINSSFVNSASITVTHGTLSLDTSGGTSTGGTFAVSAGAVLNLTGGNAVAYKGTYTGSGAGTIALANGTLQVASGGATFNFPAGLFQWTGGTIDATAGNLTNTGTLTYAGGSNVVFNAGTLTNNGTFVQTSTAYLFLENSAIFANTASGTYNLQEDGGGITELGGGTLTNAGLLEKTSGTATTFINSAFVNSASITVTTGTLALDTSGGTSTGGTFSVSPGAVLNLTGGNAVAYTGVYTGSGGGTIALSSGTLVIGSGGATFNFAAPMFQWTAGTIDVTSGNLTNAGTLAYAGTSNVVLNGAGSLVNNKSIIQKSGATLFLENGVTLNNTSKGTYDIQSDGGVTQSGGGTFLNAGLLKKTQGTGTSTISSTLNNTGRLEVHKGTISVSGAITQVAGNTLTAGKWSVFGSSSIHSTLTLGSANITTIGSAATVTLSGLNTVFSNLTNLATITGGFTLAGGQSFTTVGALTNNGKLSLSPGSVLTVSGNFVQGSAATLTVQLGGTAASPKIGSLKVTSGTITLNGHLKMTGSVQPAIGTTLVAVDNETGSAISGTFIGLPEGSTLTLGTMTFQISYVGFNSRSVTLKRTA